MKNTLYEVRREIIAREIDSLHKQGVIDEDDHKWLQQSLLK